MNPLEKSISNQVWNRVYHRALDQVVNYIRKQVEK